MKKGHPTFPGPGGGDRDDEGTKDVERRDRARRGEDSRSNLSQKKKGEEKREEKLQAWRKESFKYAS